MRKSIFRILIVVLTAIALNLSIYSQTTSISYQGYLEDEGSPANGNYNFTFRLYDSGTFGNQLGNELSRTNITVTDGIFTITNLDFGANFIGTTIWLEIDVRKGIIGSYTTLTPRQKVNSSPTSLRSLVAADAERLGGLSPSLFVRTNDPNFVRTDDPRLVDSRSPTSGSSFYIQNRTSEQSSSNFRVSGVGRATRFIANTDLSIGTTVVSNPLTVIGFGTDNGGVNGINNVIARFRQRTSGEETAISIDSISNEDSILYFSEGGDSKYQIRYDNSEEELQFRSQNGSSSDKVLTLKHNGWSRLTDSSLSVSSNLQVDGWIRLDDFSNGILPICIPTAPAPQVNRLGRCVSSKRFKNNIKNFDSGLSLIKKLRPVLFNWRDGGMLDMGLVAEEVAEVEPLLATYEDDGTTVLGVKYNRVGVIAVNAINEQQAQIESQQKEISSQKELIKKQQTEIDALKELVCLTNTDAQICKN